MKSNIVKFDSFRSLLESTPETSSKRDLSFDAFTLVKKIHSVNEALPSNISNWLKDRATSDQSRAAKKVAGWAEKAGTRISGGTSIGKSPQALVLDIKYQAGEIYVDSDGTIEFRSKEIKTAKEFAAAFDEYKRSSESNRKYFNVNEQEGADVTDIKEFPILDNAVKCAMLFKDFVTGKIKVDDFKSALKKVSDGRSHKMIDGIKQDLSVGSRFTNLISSSNSAFEYFTDLDFEGEEEDEHFDAVHDTAMDEISSIKSDIYAYMRKNKISEPVN